MTTTFPGDYGSFGTSIPVNTIVKLKAERAELIASEKASKAAAIANNKAKLAFAVASKNLKTAVDAYQNAPTGNQKLSAKAHLIKQLDQFPKCTSLTHDFLLTFMGVGTIKDAEINKAFSTLYSIVREDVYGKIENDTQRTDLFYAVLRNNIDRHNSNNGCDLCQE